jgi:peptidylprolyl isomerase
MKKFILFFGIVASAIIVRAQTDVVFYTTKGDFTVEIYDSIVPITGGNFLELVDKKFYDGVIFHRVIDNFMIQGGDPTGTGTGGPGYSIPDEFDPSLSNLQKTISMANSGPNTGGSQFFINLVNNTHLDYDKPPLTSKHPVFGKVTVNFNVVQDIGNDPVDGNNRPLVDVVMDSIRRAEPVWAGVKDELEDDNKLSLYPNPVNASSVLVVHSTYSSDAVIQIHNVLGKAVYSNQVELNAGNNRIQLAGALKNIESKGLYQLSVRTTNSHRRISFVVP